MKIKQDQIYTYGDYRKWPDDERWELIEGTAWNMSAAPMRLHQDVFGGCKVYAAPFDVMLPAEGEAVEDEVTSVVQPDISIICDHEKLTDKGCKGAPDWIVEILSPSTSKKDFSNKLHLYQKHGVKEYWIVDPGNRYVHVYLLEDDGRYPEIPMLYLTHDTVPSTVIEHLQVDLTAVFRMSQSDKE